MRLLIADDEPDIAEIVSFAARMSWSGCEVINAADSAEALGRFAESLPDLVILDV